MSFYDLFSKFYDASLAWLYAEHRALAAEALRLTPGLKVLDLPCGTGASFEAIGGALGQGGRLVGVDLSEGMLRQARARSSKLALACEVSLVHGDVEALSLEALLGEDGRPFDRAHVFLGMSVFKQPELAFERIYQAVKPGGRLVFVDVYAETLTMQGRLVNRLAGAEIRRRFWEPLERVGQGFELIKLPYRKQHGGQIMLASADKA